MDTIRFELTDTHIKLLRRFYVCWWDCETGAPAIDPKRPYGNSDVPADIHEILTGESIGCTDSVRDELTEDEIESYLKLHSETQTALQIVLRTGGFRTGIYQACKYERDWKLVS